MTSLLLVTRAPTPPPRMETKAAPVLFDPRHRTLGLPTAQLPAWLDSTKGGTQSGRKAGSNFTPQLVFEAGAEIPSCVNLTSSFSAILSPSSASRSGLIPSSHSRKTTLAKQRSGCGVEVRVLLRTNLS